MLLDSINTYYNFAYTVSPSTDDFKCLHVARDCILSCHALWKWRLAPTTHYLTNHAIIDAETDKTGYSTLQEGVEHLNHEDKVTYRVTFASPTTVNVAESCWQHLINQYQLRLRLTCLGYAPPPYQLISASTEVEYAKHTVTMPIHAPCN